MIVGIYLVFFLNFFINFLIESFKFLFLKFYIVKIVSHFFY